MFKMRKGKGQSALEYAVLVIIIAAALLTMQVYIKRGVQGRMKASTDDIGEQFSTAGNVTLTEKSFTRTIEESKDAGAQSSTFQAGSYTNRHESINLDDPNLNTEYFGCAL
jgi:Flp pilus assembly pilin Flp